MLPDWAYTLLIQMGAFFALMAIAPPTVYFGSMWVMGRLSKKKPSRVFAGQRADYVKCLDMTCPIHAYHEDLRSQCSPHMFPVSAPDDGKHCHIVRK